MFKEIFYWMSTRLAKIKSNDNPSLNAYFIICFLQSFNIGTLFIFLNYFAKLRFPKNAYIYFGVSLAILLLILNYQLYYKHKEEIFEKYEKFSPKRKVKGLVYFWLYVLLSTIIFFLSTAHLVQTTGK
jgi:hypothetical protein